MPIAVLDAGGAAAPAGPDKIPQTVVGLAYRMSRHMKPTPFRGRRMRRMSLAFATLLFWLILGAM